MKIKHEPIFDTKFVEEIYSKKDGVPVKYVCTSAPNRSATYAADIFYRETPHPEFGNRYFALYQNAFADDIQVMITNADKIEDLDFEMIEVDGMYHYSQHRHDYRGVGNGIAIDGGREYYRATFSDPAVYNACARAKLKVKDGEFVNED
jgi:hypothetical protein